MEPIVSSPESANPILCQAMKSIFGVRRMTISGLILRYQSNRDGPRFPFAQPSDDQQPSHQYRREQRSQHADAQGHGNALARAGAEPEHQRAGDQGRHMAVEDRAEGALEAGV